MNTVTDVAVDQPIILFSGMAADAAVAEPQLRAFPKLVVPPWPKPSEDESLTSYCERLANELRPLGAVAIGGISFGGVIAMEVARFLNPRCVILIASVRSPKEMPWRIRVLRNFLWLLPLVPIRWMQWLARAIPLWSSVFAGIVQEFRQADPVTLRWSIRQVLRWQGPPPLSCPLYQVHGDRDFLFPYKLTAPDVLIRGGGHLISMTRGKQVNEFIRACLDKIAES